MPGKLREREKVVRLNRTNQNGGYSPVIGRVHDVLGGVPKILPRWAGARFPEGMPISFALGNLACKIFCDTGDSTPGAECPS